VAKVVELQAQAAIADVPVDDGRAPNRILLFPIGKAAKPRDDRAAWIIEDQAHAQAVIDATQARLGATDMMIDYDHQSERAPKVAGTAPAAGWVKGLSAEADGIYADVEWTGTARQQLRERTYRYISPWFGFDKATRRVTRIFNAALTNTPALELQAVAAADLHGEPASMDKIISALGLAAGADEDAIVSAIADLKTSTALASVQPIAAALQLGEGATAEEVATAAADFAQRPADLKPIALALGAAETASVEELATAATELKKGVIDPAKFVPIETHQAALTKLTGIEEAQATAAVDDAIAGGKVAPANRDFYLAAAKKDLPAFKALVTNSPSILTPGADASLEGRDVASADRLTEDDQAICSVTGISPEDFLAQKKKENA
jgi:phage I-like protein